jgi:hypothetical protein
MSSTAGRLVWDEAWEVLEGMMAKRRRADRQRLATQSPLAWKDNKAGAQSPRFSIATFR